MSDSPQMELSGEKSEEDEHIATEMAIIARAVDEWNSRLGRQFGPLSRPQRRMLRLLHTETTVRVGDLGEQLGLTTAGTTRMLNKLEERGYATRSRMAQHDQRQVYVTLTSAGAAALQEAELVFLERMRTTLGVLTASERAELAKLLQALSERG